MALTGREACSTSAWRTGPSKRRVCGCSSRVNSSARGKTPPAKRSLKNRTWHRRSSRRSSQNGAARLRPQGPDRSRNPHQLCLIGARFVRGEVPVDAVGQTRGAPVQECEVGAGAMEVGVNEVPVAHRRQVLRVEKPYRLRRLRKRCEADGLFEVPGAVDVFIETIVKEIAAVAAPPVGRAQPDGLPHIRL